MNSEKQSTNLQMTLREVNRVGEVKKNIPKLRFKGYEDAWEQRKLGTAINVKSGKDYKHLDEGDVPVYGTGGYMLSVSEALEDTRDAIGIGRKGTIDKPFVLKAPFWTVDTLFYCIPKENNSLSFLYSLFQSINWKLYDESTGVPSLSKTAIDGVTIKLTSEDEQSSIGECFESVDNLITLHQRKYDALKSMKKTLLSKMFPKDRENVPEIRFKGFTDAWEQRKLGEFCDMFNGDRSSKYPNASDMLPEGIPFINAGDLQEGRVNLETCNKISKSKYDELSGAKLSEGDIVYCLRGSLGKNAYIDNFSEGTIASSLVAIRPKMINGRFLFHILNSDIEYKQRVLRDEGAAQPNLSAKSLSEFFIPIPEAEEDQSVADFFDNVDNYITLHQRKLDELKNMKKTLLQQMFV